MLELLLFPEGVRTWDPAVNRIPYRFLSPEQILIFSRLRLIASPVASSPKYWHVNNTEHKIALLSSKGIVSPVGVPGAGTVTTHRIVRQEVLEFSY